MNAYSALGYSATAHFTWSRLSNAHTTHPFMKGSTDKASGDLEKKTFKKKRSDMKKLAPVGTTSFCSSSACLTIHFLSAQITVVNSIKKKSKKTKQPMPGIVKSS